MNPTHNKNSYLQAFRLNGNSFLYDDAVNGNIELGGKSDFEKKSLEFIRCWLSGQDVFLLKTSGSTGKPKEIKFTKKQLEKSAARTNRHFNLRHGQTILSCLDTKFVAGVMMIVRAIEGKLKLIIVDPLQLLQKINNESKIEFCAFTPYQFESLLDEKPQTLANIHTILIGGAAINPSLEKQMEQVNSNIFHSYAMTETLTHIAIRGVNGDKRTAIYSAVEGVRFSLDKRACLVIHDQILGIDGLVTNDLVELIDERSFKWIGRIDNVINSGGIKIHVEELENRIGETLQGHGVNQRFCILSIPDEKLTNKIILLIERPERLIDDVEILDILKRNLLKYHDPKVLIEVSKLVLANTGKIDRIENARLYLSKLTINKL